MTASTSIPAIVGAPLEPSRWLGGLIAPFRHLGGLGRSQVSAPEEPPVLQGAKSSGGCRAGESRSLDASVTGDIEALLICNAVCSLLDLGCGDAEPLLDGARLRCAYLGADIDATLIARQQADRAGPSRQFIVTDARLGPLPRAEVVLCRDLLTTLSLNDAKLVLRNIRASGATLLLASTNADVRKNEIGAACRSGWNLSLAPFKLGESLASIPDDHARGSGRSLDLWRLH